MGTRFKADSPGGTRSRTGYSEITDSDAEDDLRSWADNSTEYSDYHDGPLHHQPKPSVSLPPPSPRDPRSKAKYNIFSRLFFIWLEPLFYLGCRKELKQKDLYAHPGETDSEKLLNRFNHFWTKELERKKHGQKARLWLAVARCFWWRLLVQGLSIVIEVAILIAQSIMLGDLSEYFGITDPTDEETRDAYLYAVGLILMSLTVVILHSHSFLMGQKMSMITRIITTAAIYQKVLSLSQLNIGEVSVGHVVNLVSNDVQRFEPAFPHLPYLWVTPLHLVVFTGIVYQEVGWSVFLASGFILLQIPLQIVLARVFVYLRLKSARVTDDRIRVMNEVIAGIKVIKMYAWENAFKKHVSQLRKQESRIIFRGALIRACNLAYMIVSISIIMWLMLSVHVSAGGELSTKQVFTTLSLLTALRLSSYFFVLAILGASEGKVAFSRIQNLLEMEDIPCHKGIEPSQQEYTDEVADVNALDVDGDALMSTFPNKMEEYRECGSTLQKEEDHFRATTPSTKRNGSCRSFTTTEALVRVENLSVSWSYQPEKAIFFDISFEVNQVIPLLAVVGAVGTGKSTLLQCLLGELRPLEGFVDVMGRVSYASQEPWVFTGTLRDNILFGMPYIPEWYNTVIEACSLDEDMLELVDGDLTEVGERGVTLSGGQKARVNLARAIYRDADIYLLDDPLSAVDISVATHLFNNCIRGLLGDKLVILVTHQLQFALQADKILVIKEGCQEVYGSHEELLEQGIDPNYLLGLIRDEDELDEEEREMFAYKLIYDAEPPSPTTLSLLSLVDATGRITPYSFGFERPGSVSTAISDGYTSVTTPLALYGHSMNNVNGSPFEQMHGGDSPDGLNFVSNPCLDRTSPEINILQDSKEQPSPPPFIFAPARPPMSSPTDFQLKERLPRNPMLSGVRSPHRLSPTEVPFPKRPFNIPGAKGLPLFVPSQCSPIPGSPVIAHRKQIGKDTHISGLTQVSAKNRVDAGLPHVPSKVHTDSDDKVGREFVLPLEIPATGQVKLNAAPKLSQFKLRPCSPSPHEVPNPGGPVIQCIPPTPPLSLAKKSKIPLGLTNLTTTSEMKSNCHVNENHSFPNHQSGSKNESHASPSKLYVSRDKNDANSVPDGPEIAFMSPTPPLPEDVLAPKSPTTPEAQLFNPQLQHHLHARSPSGRTSATSLLFPPGLPRSGLSSPLNPRRMKRSPTPSPVLPKKSHTDDEEHLHSTLEPARFDAASIYSGRSMVSLAASAVSAVREKEGTSNEAQHKQKETDEPQADNSEEKGHGTISLKTYYDFFKAGGSFAVLIAVFVIFGMGEVSVVLSDWWLSDWADCSSIVELLPNNSTVRSTCLLSTPQRIGIYSVTTLMAIILNFSRAILFYYLCLNASHVLHNNMFEALLKSPLLFFDNNPVGRVLNRFSKDIGYLDDLLPYTFCEYLLLLLRCLAVIIMAVASNVWLIIPASVLVVTFLVLRWYYLKTSRDVKRLEAVARSPLYSHISTTLVGLPTIRAFSKERMSLEQFHTHQNQHSQAWYLYLVTVRWFGLRIDLLSTLFLATVALLSVPLASQLNAGLVGLGLTYTISLTDMLQYTIRLSADVENTMVSAERVMSYGKLEPEAPLETLPPNEKPPSNWPDKGKITFEDVAFKYSSDLPLVLKNLCVTVQPSEKVGIVGRTGAGKSSLISVLYRLAEPFGLITIDDVDTKSIGLHDLRKRMSIIPQDPVLFSGTMRYNLDPFDEYSDAELWEALEQVQLKAAVQQLEGQLGAEVSEGGSNFSVGQRQLVCLARALLRKNKVLVLDEATANVDQRTDEIIQRAIRENFSECTVLTIAHRLNTIMDSDKIMVLKKGKLKEFDSPYKLLQDPLSRFYKMVEKTGPVASGKLHQMALEGHLRKTFRRHGRITPLLAKLSGKNLQTRSLLQRAKGVLPGFLQPSGLSRIQERRPSIISSNSFPSALNEIGLNTINVNDPNLQSLRLPSDPNVAAAGDRDGDWNNTEDRESD